jgi:RNA-binding protein
MHEYEFIRAGSSSPAGCAAISGAALLGGDIIDKKTASQLKATIWIGKNGVSEQTYEEIKRQIKDREMVKVKWLRSTDVDPAGIAVACGAELVQTRGRTMVLARQKKPSR